MIAASLLMLLCHGPVAEITLATYAGPVVVEACLERARYTDGVLRVVLSEDLASDGIFRAGFES